MPTLLHQAVQLAQAGQRAEARLLIWQFLQTEPNNETAWLWLASVAADQAEYQRALNEVLRINPENQRAKQLLAEFQQQVSPPASPYAPPQQQVSPPPPVSPYTPPPQQQVSPPPPGSPYTPPPQQQVSPPPPRYSATPPPGAPYAPPTPVEVQVKTVQKRRGCLGCSIPGCGGGCLGCGGCGQGCLLAFLVLVILPAIICGGLSLSPISLGPFDWPASYLPGEMGRKTISFETSAYNISLKAPRSWYLVQTNDQMWGFWRGWLEATIPFENSSQQWKDLETDPNYQAEIVDINLATLNKGGDVVALALSPGTVSGDYSCATVRTQTANASYGYPALYDYGGSLCGYREQDNIQSGPAAPVFKGVDPPAQVRVITFYTPVSSSAALGWRISIPEKIYNQRNTAKDIEVLIGSVKTTPK
jgi:hypothetical protein